MSKNPDQISELLDDLSDDEVTTLGNLIANLNRLEMVDEAPRYDGDEISLIGRFQDLDDEEEEEADELVLDEDGEPMYPESAPIAAERNFQENSFAPES